jgi:hypothetical protein
MARDEITVYHMIHIIVMNHLAYSLGDTESNVIAIIFETRNNIIIIVNIELICPLICLSEANGIATVLQRG